MAKLHNTLTGTDLHNNKGIDVETALTSSMIISASAGSHTGAVTSSAMIVPSATNTYDLGSATKAWRKLYVITSSIEFVNPAGTTIQTLTADSDGLNFGTGQMSGSAISGSGLMINGNGNITGNLTLGGNLTMGDAASDSITVQADFTSNLIPNASDSYNLGSTGQRWNDVWVSGSVTANGGAHSLTSATTIDIDADGALTIDGGSIGIGTDADVAFDIDTAALDIDSSGAITIDGTSTVSIDGADDMNFTITSGEAGEDLTIAQVGGNDSSILITAAGTGTDAVSIDATAGSMVIAPSLTDGKTLKLGKNGAVEMIFSPHGTAASEKWSLTNTAGTATDAVKLIATAGGVDIDGGTAVDILAATTLTAKGATGASLGDDTGTWEFSGDGALSETGMTTISMTPSSTVDVDAGGAVTIDSSAAAITIGGDAVGQKVSVGGDTANRTEVELNAILVDINAGTGGVTVDGTGAISLDSGAASNFTTSAGLLTLNGAAGVQLTGGVTASTHISASGALTSHGVNTSTHILPITSDGAQIGSTSKQWSDVFLAEGGAINWDNGDFTATQVGNLLTLTGGNTRVDRLEVDGANDYIDVDTDLKVIAAADITLDPGGNNVKPGSDNTDALGVSGSAWSDLFLGNGAVINFDQDVTATHSSNLLTITGGNTRVDRLEIDSANDYIDVSTDLQIIAAADVVVDPAGGELKVDGNVVPNSDSADSLGASGTAWLKLWVDDIDLNGQGSISMGGTGRIDLDANDNTSIRASADDVITFEAGAVDVSQITSTMAISGSSVATGSFGVLTVAGGVDQTITPLNSDGAALGTTSKMWSDLFLASGGVVNFNNGDLTLTHSSNKLTLAGGDLDVDGAITVTGNITGDSGNMTVAASGGDTLVEGVTFSGNDVTIPGNLIVQGDRIEARVGSLQVEDHTITVGSGSTTSATMDQAGLDFGVSGSVAYIHYDHSETALSSSHELISNGARFVTTVSPFTSNGAALGTTALQWSDLFLAEGGVINWDNGDATITQTGNLISLEGGNTRVERLEVDGANDYIDVDTDLKVISAADIILDPGGNNVKPGTDNADALGVSGSAWSDLFLGNGAVINFDQDVTATHSSNLLTITGGNTRVDRLEVDGANDYVDVDTDLKIVAAADITLDPGGNNVKPGSDNADALGVSGTAWSDLFLGDEAVINFNAGDVTLTHSSNLLDIDGGNTRVDRLELDSASDYLDVSTDLQIIAAADITLNPGGNNVKPGGDSEDDLGVDGTAWRKLYVDDIDLNGQGRIDLDVDADTSVRSSADDVITFEAGAVDIAQMTSTMAISGSSVSTGSLGALVIDEIIGNWTNAGNTVADLGTLTTVDINGGTVDGATIGAASHTTIKGTTIDATTDFTIDGLVLTADTITNDAGLSIVASSGDITLDPAGNNVLPGGDSADDLGVSGTAWRKLFVDDIDLNGQGSISIGGTGRIDLDADDDTSIRASADDVITYEAGAADIAQMTATMALSGSSVSTGSFARLKAVDRLDVGNGTSAEPSINFVSDGDTGFFLQSADDIGVSLAAVEEFRFANGGTFHADADIVAYSSTVASDMSLKENITDTKYGLDTVMQLRGVDFDWKRDDMGHSVGVLAQEVEAIIPEVVKEHDGLRGKFKAVDYNKLVPILIESVKTLKLEIDELKMEKN